ncbi:LOW QUALITY PROTEIN: hypothetical protein PanWU01x14_219660 [Parasponia andersonii]|uniref:Uncharacterized protein n=1 Tax=Parasponia andersonii TaxID=3476 RepID=A0A2P5BQA7_PARAD|nr:LOW QUALITY PROTEIN: hypothetical protein PanWU01x14_219660 [Parasponia andersonii]
MERGSHCRKNLRITISIPKSHLMTNFIAVVQQIHLKEKACLWCDLTQQSSYPNSQKNYRIKIGKKELPAPVELLGYIREISLLQFHVFNSSPGQYELQSTHLFRRKRRYPSLSHCNNCLSLTKLPILLKVQARNV